MSNTVQHRRIVVACTGLFIAVLFAGTAAQDRSRPDADTPEAVLRSLVAAIYGVDVAAYERLTLPHPLRSRLTQGGSPNTSRLRDLQEDPDGLQIKQIRPLLYRGTEASAGTDGRYPEGTTGLYMVAHHGQPMIVGLVRKPDGWKADLRWWIAGAELSSGRNPTPGSPEAAIRSLLAAMLRLDRTRAARFITNPKSIDLLFAGAPSQREPSGVLDATVGEMPLVEVGPGEFYSLPTGRVVEGTATADRKVLVGWFGPIEMPFVVQKAGNEWRVEAEPYFVLMNR